GQGYLEKILNPGASDTVTIQTPWNAKMNGNSWNFTHANGTVKPHKVAKIDETKAPAGGAKTQAKKERKKALADTLPLHVAVRRHGDEGVRRGQDLRRHGAGLRPRFTVSHDERAALF